MRLVLDTNIVMDLLHFADPRTQPLLHAIESGKAQCVTDSDCLAELVRVVAYPEFGLGNTAQEVLLRRYRKLAVRCEAQPDEAFALPRCRDADDQKFLILAARSHADLLITRDNLLLRLARHKHKPPPCPILTAEAAAPLFVELAAEDPARIP